MSGVFYGLATVAISLVIRWLVLNDTGPSGRKQGASADTAIAARVGGAKTSDGKKSKRWRAPGRDF